MVQYNNNIVKRAYKEITTNIKLQNNSTIYEGNDMLGSENTNNQAANDTEVSVTLQDHFTERERQEGDSLIDIQINEDIIVPPRSEKIVKFRTNIDNEILCHSKELGQGVFLSNCLTQPINNVANVSILNITEESKKIKPFTMTISTLTQYDTFALNTTINNTDHAYYCHTTPNSQNREQFQVRKDEKIISNEKIYVKKKVK